MVWCKMWVLKMNLLYMYLIEASIKIFHAVFYLELC